jgi:allantoinase
MPDYDLLIRGATPLPEIGIANGVFAGFTAGSAREEIDATGLLALPGVIDAHVHFNEPGRTEWEGWATGSRAAVAGGVTMVCDMPLNSHPPVVTADAYAAKRRAAEAQSVCDFALWGGLIPGHVDQLDALAAAGVIGFKAFMAHSGIDDFPKADLATLRAGMQRAARLGLPVAVHAEFDRPLDPQLQPLQQKAAPRDLLDQRARRDPRDPPEVPRSGSGIDSDATRQDNIDAGAGDAGAGTAAGAGAYIASRPIESECEAIRAAIDIAAETGCALHIVHVSSGSGIALVVEARARGIDVTAETCPHYLVFTDADMERLGAVAKCAPPFRDARERAALLEHVRAGRVDTIGSDHSPSPWSMKTDPDFFRVWGGIAGIQHLLPLLLDEGLDPALIARLTAGQVAQRFRLPGKGQLATGYDADLTLVDPHDDYAVTAESLLYRHHVSPYVGRRLRARVRRTIRRGETVFHDGRVTADRGGRLTRPRPHLSSDSQ